MRIMDNEQLGWRGWDGKKWQYGQLFQRGRKKGVLYTAKNDSLYPDLTGYSHFYLEPKKGKGLVHIPDPTTLGRCTGIKDQDGKTIYEGDILLNTNKDELYLGIVQWDPVTEDFQVYYQSYNLLVIKERRDENVFEEELLTGEGVFIQENRISDPDLYDLMTGQDLPEIQISDHEGKGQKETTTLA